MEPPDYADWVWGRPTFRKGNSSERPIKQCRERSEHEIFCLYSWPLSTFWGYISRKRIVGKNCQIILLGQEGSLCGSVHFPSSVPAMEFLNITIIIIVIQEWIGLLIARHITIYTRIMKTVMRSCK